MDVNGIMKLNIHVADDSEAKIFQGAEEILQSLRPKWQKTDINYKMLTDGITNKLVKCKVKDSEDEEAVLIRIYGNKTDLLIDRKAETRNIKMLNTFALAPSLYATFKNGLAYEFVPGCTLTSHTVRQPEVYQLVARHMAKLHKVPANNKVDDDFKDDDKIQTTKNDRDSVLWRKFDSFLALVPDTFTSERIHKKFLQLNISKSHLQQEVQQMQTHLRELHSPVVFCHNDLLLGNVIFTKASSVEGNTHDTVTFIDFEYADWNYQAYDIGNHFAEFAGIDNVDYDYYPSKELQYAWLKEYVQEYCNETATEIDLDLLYVQVNRFALASHLLWGIWALIQAEHSHIDFDFIEYSSLRFTEYFRRKNEFLSLPLPNCN